jgi:hypothetical protein
VDPVQITPESLPKPYNLGTGFIAGNPGRPKGILDKRADAGRKAAQALAAKAWGVVEELLADGVRRIVDGKEVFFPNDERIRLDAAKIVIEYAHGKARTSISIEDLRESVEESARERGLDASEVLALAREIAQGDASPS